MPNEPYGTSVLGIPGGRRLDVLAAGPEDGMPLLFHNGTPSGLVAFPAMVDAAAARGLRTVMYARPGYGGSTGQPGRRIADAATDAAAVLDGLGARQFVTVGWSGGGPHALACAALLPGRCLAAASLAGVAPAPDPAERAGQAPFRRYWSGGPCHAERAERSAGWARRP